MGNIGPQGVCGVEQLLGQLLVKRQALLLFLQVNTQRAFHFSALQRLAQPVA